MTDSRIPYLVLLFVALLSNGIHAHALEPGYLRIAEISEDTARIFFRVADVQGRAMPIQAQFPADCTSPEQPPLRFDGKAWVSAWFLHCPRGIRGAAVQVRGLAHTKTDVLVQYTSLLHEKWSSRLTPEATRLVIPTEPTTWDVFTTYLSLGIDHILDGLDHLCFVLALLLLITKRTRLLGAITAFSVAHSITLAASVTGMVSLRPLPIEALIALSIMFVAVEIRLQETQTLRLSERYPFVVSFSFGLLHGFGFAGALREIGLPTTEVPMALLSFNIGVELGQLSFVVVVLLFSYVLRILSEIIFGFDRYRNDLSQLLAFAIGGVSSFWFLERISSM